MSLVPRRGARLDVLLPMSIAAEAPHLREKTLRIGWVGRILATFRVDTVILYPDSASPDIKNATLVKELLDYLVTAPYLRRRLYPLRRVLRYAGLLPPLNIPTHPERGAIRRQGTHYREALVIAEGETSTLEAGLSKPVKLGRRLKKGSRPILKIRVSGGGRVKIRALPRERCEVYPGYRAVIVNRPLREIVGKYGLRIATSRLGKPFPEEASRISELASSSESICVAFGSADKGLHEIAAEQGFKLEEVFDAVLNFAPQQAVKTIRTEEALAYTLAQLNNHIP
ncbi:MAG: hypothetical protein NXY59_09375 [Aigarchaeota archaeon]|nr:hypothetical protein [Candidatus Pelearchaeum maunauluense]